jgi:hypothetical protein
LNGEDKIHCVLVLVLGISVVALRLGEPPAAPAQPEKPVPSAALLSPALEVRRSELDAPIQRLAAWVGEARTRAASPEETLLGWQALGRSGKPTEDARQLAPVFRTEPAAALSVLLEAGLPIDTAVSFDGAPAPLGEWVARELDKPSPKAGVPDPWQLDLLSFAMLAGITRYRTRLEHLTQASLTHLDRQMRASPARQGRELTAADIDGLARVWRLPGSRQERATDLHLSQVVFRAVAVLQDPDLDTQARRHLNALLFRFRVDRALTAHLLANADAKTAASVRLSAVEELGRLEQALYNAHLAFRGSGTAAPPQRVGVAMRQIARELIDHVAALQLEGATPAQGAAQAELLQAAVQALRGLRTARAATPSAAG